MRAEANIVNMEIPGELAYVCNKLDGKRFWLADVNMKRAEHQKGL